MLCKTGRLDLLTVFRGRDSAAESDGEEVCEEGVQGERSVEVRCMSGGIAVAVVELALRPKVRFLSFFRCR